MAIIVYLWLPLSGDTWESGVFCALLPNIRLKGIISLVTG